jgi:rhodanese-related sulfurtransferase
MIILALVVILGFSYNAFSPKGLPLIRVAPVKVEVADSLLFGTTQDTVRKSIPPASRTEQPEVADPPQQRLSPGSQTTSDIARKEKKEQEGVLNIITLDQLKRLLAEKRGVLIDARSEEEYGKGHIAGAKNMSALEVEKHFEEIAVMPRDTLVLIYCNNPDCHLGRTLAEFMQQFNFTKLYLYDDGWDGWTAAGMPVDTTGFRGGE